MRKSRGDSADWRTDSASNRENAAASPVVSDSRRFPAQRGRPRGWGRRGNYSHSRVVSTTITLTELKALMSKDTNEIIISLMDSRFKATVESIDSTEILVTILCLLSKIFQTSLHQTNQNELMALLLSTDFFNIKVTKFVSNEIRFNLTAFDDLVNIFTAYSKKMPDTFLNQLDAYVRLCANVSKMQQGLDQEVVEKMINLEKKIEELEEEKKIKKSSIDQRKMKANANEPPENFREIPITPLITEVQTRNEPFLRENVVKGPYNDVEHYLDVHFRLLREDFVAQLRDGISDFISHRDYFNKRNMDVKLYKNVKIGESTYNRNGVLYVLKFNKDHFSNINWKFSKRLLFGSLLCLSSDSFETAIFATVAGRQMKDLEMGIVVVKFEDDLGVKKLLTKEQLRAVYTVAESQAYFEAYRHVLKGLQSFNSENLPLQKYIVFGERIMQPPAYLKETTIFKLTSDSMGCQVMDIKSWPSASELGLDESQRKAMHLALTSAVGIIQGPPGTGKTYIGLKIVQVLLNNKLLWESDCLVTSSKYGSEIIGPGSILVVCLTNHALDQFLEGMLPFTDKLVRVGGQSENGGLRDFNLRNIQWSREDIDSIKIKSAVSMGYRNINDLKDSLLELTNTIRCLHVAILRENILHSKAAEKMTDFDVRLFYSLRSGFFEVFGVDLTTGTWQPPSLIAIWLGLTLNPDIVSDRMLYDFLKDGDQDRYMKKYQATPTQEEIKNKETDDLIEIDDQWTTVSRNRQLDADDEILFSFQEDETSPSNFCIDVRKLDQPEYYGFNIEKTDTGTYNLIRQMGTLRRMIAERELCNKTSMSDEKIIEIRNVWYLELEDRWLLYRRWMNMCKEANEEKITELQKDYENDTKKLNEIIHAQELSTLKKFDVIGMTTTGAAKYLEVVRALKPKIVIVEEAAEVLESHIITSLSSNTEHLILIGDHKQLRPNVNVYTLARRYHLDVSLFERMIKNEVPHETLRLQHRMRPEISKLLVPHVYRNLQDHPSVFSYPNVNGMTSNIFFLNHNNPEKEMEDMKTHVNVFEAEYVVAFANYLLQQGYKPCQITILTTYTGQLFELQKLMKKETFQGVRVTVVDNFQGEENDIILLSFVRSSEDGTIGFLRIDNRVNVALSRAKMGLYCIGNFEFFSGKSTLWKDVVNSLKNDELIGNAMPIKCQRHGTVSMINSSKDFKKYAPEGRCLQICNDVFDCGHTCKRVCHFGYHECEEMCGEILCDLQHPCPRKCIEKCEPCQVSVLKKHVNCSHELIQPCHADMAGIKCLELVNRYLKCGHETELACHFDPNEHTCSVRVKRESPICKHQIDLKCSEDILLATCKEKCNHLLPCEHECPENCHQNKNITHEQIKCIKRCEKVVCERGHKCTNSCAQPCNKCMVVVTKELLCGHELQHPCSKEINPLIDRCQQLCNRILPCNHACKRECYQSCGGCEEMVRKILPCNHSIMAKCSSRVSSLICKEPCEEVLPCGHKCSKLCSESHENECKFLVNQNARCGHLVSVPCFMKDKPTINLMCNQPCNTILPCKHKCVGTCKKCFNGRIHVPCIEKCNRKQICGHVCTFPCALVCPSCDKTCKIECEHKSFSKRCGQKWRRCNSKCVWSCSHFECSKKCHELCDRPRCNEPCKEILKCGHECVGICGEECLELCKICNNDELLRNCDVSDLADDTRFIKLVDCKHYIKVENLDDWMDKDENEVKMKSCPMCNVTITRSRRYGNVIKQRMADVQETKEKTFALERCMRKTMNQVENQLKENKFELKPELKPELQPGLRGGFGRGRPCSPVDNEIKCINSAGFYLKKRLVGRRPVYQNQLTVIQNQVNILIQIKKFKNKLDKNGKGWEKSIHYFVKAFQRLVDRLMMNKEGLNQFEMKNIIKELVRIEICSLYLKARSEVKSTNDDKAEECLQQVQKYFNDLSVWSDEEEELIFAGLIKADPSIFQSGITHVERVTLVEDVNLNEGNWFKSREGHVYEERKRAN